MELVCITTNALLLYVGTRVHVTCMAAHHATGPPLSDNPENGETQVRNGGTWPQTPYQEELLASAVAAAVRVVTHEHTHALSGRRCSPTSRPYALAMTEGVTELATRLLLLQVLDEAAVTRTLPRVTVASVTPVYVKHT